MHHHPVQRFVLACALVAGVSVAAAPNAAVAAISRQDLKEWLTYIASDELEGRAVYSSGIGLAAAYIEDHLHAWGARPAGDNGSYLQTVRVLGVKSTSRSTVTVNVAGTSRTFADGDGITFPKNAGGKRSFTVDRVEFAGYGLDAGAAGHMDFRGKSVKNAAVVWLGAQGPRGIDATYRRLLTGRSRYATEQLGAAASIGPEQAAGRAGGAGGAGREGAPVAGAAGGTTTTGRGAPLPVPDFTTVQRLDSPLPPNVSADDAFFEFLFSRAPTKYEELKRKAAAQEELPSFPLEGVTLSFNIDTDYEVVRTQLTQNVVAVIDGSDAQLKNTYVALGAHYDHVGYAEGEVVKTADGTRRLGAVGRVTPGHEDDRI